MVVQEDDLKLYESTDGHGGARTEDEVSSTVNDMFDVVSGDESSPGDTEYRIMYVRNESASQANGVKIHLSANYNSVSGTVTTAAGDIAIGLNIAKNTTATTLTDEGTAPSGVTFSSPANRAAGIDIGDLDEDDYRAVYVRRTTANDSSAKDDATATFEITADSSA